MKNRFGLISVTAKCVFTRVFILYIFVGSAIYGLVDYNKLVVGYVNFLMQSEVDVKDFSLGKTPLNSNALKMAVRYYQQLLKFVPDDGILRGNLGFCYYYLGNYSRALEEYRRAVEVGSPVEPLQWDVALILFQMGKVKDSAQIWERYLNNSNVVRNYFASLKVQLRLIKKEGAFVFVDRMEERFKSDEKETYIKLSESYYLLKQYSAANDVAVAGLKRFPNDRWLHYVLGLSHFAQGHFLQAAEHFNQVIANNPQDMSAYYYHAVCMEKLGFSRARLNDLMHLAQLRSQGIVPLLFPKNDVKLHFNTEILMIRYYLKHIVK